MKNFFSVKKLAPEVWLLVFALVCFSNISIVQACNGADQSCVCDRSDLICLAEQQSNTPAPAPDSNTPSGNSGNCDALPNGSSNPNFQSCLGLSPEAQQNLVQNSYGSTPTSPNSSTTPSSTTAQTCVPASNQANKCCGDPVTCYYNDLANSGSGNTADASGGGSSISQVMIALAGTAAMGLGSGSGSITDMCQSMGQASEGAGALNAAVAANCQTYISKCQTACATASGNDDANPQLCVPAQQQQQKAMMQTAASGNAMMMANLCQKQAAEQAALLPNLNGRNTCSGAFGATPACQALCTSAAGMSSPRCAGYTGGSDGLLGENGAIGGINGLSPGDSLAQSLQNQLDPQTQNPVFPTTAAAQSALAQGPAGQGNGSLPASPNLNNMGGGGAGVPAAAGGYDTGILKGTQAGNGYSGSGMRSGGSGGFSGYGGSATKADSILGKNFNLKNFLPGNDQKKAPAFRGIASVMPDISPAGSDIFKKITDRFYQVCLQDRLYDCATLKKMKTQRD